MEKEKRKRTPKDPLDAIIDYAMTADPAEVKAAAVAFNRIALRRTQEANGNSKPEPQSRQRRIPSASPNKSEPVSAGYNETHLADGGK